MREYKGKDKKNSLNSTKIPKKHPFRRYFYTFALAFVYIVIEYQYENKQKKTS